MAVHTIFRKLRATQLAVVSHKGSKIKIWKMGLPVRLPIETSCCGTRVTMSNRYFISTLFAVQAIVAQIIPVLQNIIDDQADFYDFEYNSWMSSAQKEEQLQKAKVTMNHNLANLRGLVTLFCFEGARP